MSNKLGLDLGTKNIVMAYREKNKVKFRHEINGFIDLEQSDGFAKNLLVQQGIPFIAREKGLIALGAKAEDMAYTFGKSLMRPMENGVLSVSEQEAMKIMAVIIKSLINKFISDDTFIYYCIPGNTINKNINIEFHKKIIESIFGSLNSEKKQISTQSINEARALAISSTPDKTAVAISFGAGMVNISYCLYGLPAYEFSMVGAGDWIDAESARVTGNMETMSDGRERAMALVTKKKEEMTLGDGVPTDNLERAIYLNYQILIERVAKGIANGFNQNESKARAGRPMPIVVAGGTASINGFLKFFETNFRRQQMPFELGEVKMAQRPLFAVAEGCLIAAEMHEAGS